MILLALLACRDNLPVPPSQIDGDPTMAWGALLGEVVTPDGYVDYDFLEKNREPLDGYLHWMAQPEVVPKNPAKRKAFWLNAYNALVMWSVLDLGRPDSVLDAGRFTFFFRRAFLVGHDRVSLYDVEHERLRLRTMDFRLHAAISCAARSCPPLRRTLYAMPDLDTQLGDQMRRWVNDPARGVRVEQGVAVMSPIFDWYARDFSFWTAGDDLCTLTGRFAQGDLKTELDWLSTQGCPHTFFDYDWSLNDAR